METKQVLIEKMENLQKRFADSQQQINVLASDVDRIKTEAEKEIKVRQDSIGNLKVVQDVMRGEYKSLLEIGMMLNIFDAEGKVIEEEPVVPPQPVEDAVQPEPEKIEE